MINISVIIPSYNRVTSIERSIESVLSQDFRGKFEIIVSDDGSTDGTIELVESKYKKEVILLKKPIDCKDQGAAGARNRGIAIAKGDCVCFLDSDDTYENSFFSRCYETLSNDTSLGYVYCRVNKSIKLPNDRVLLQPWTRPKLSYIDRKYHVLHRAFCICTIGIMCRRSVLLQVGAFDTKLVVGEDSDMWIKISEISKGRFLDFIGATYYIDGFDNNQLTKSTTSSRKRRCGLQVYQKALYRFDKREDKDRIRLLIIHIGIMLLEDSSIKNDKLRLLIVMGWQLAVRPISMIRYMILRWL